MKIQENYFYRLDNSKDVKVIWKKYDKACVMELGISYPSAIVDLDRLSGIYLSEKILKSVGFKKENDNFYLKINEDWQYIELNHNADETENIFIGYITTEQMDKNKTEPIFLDYINFLHELQGLVFALKKEELFVSAVS